MSRVLDANEVCARALRLVGAFPTSQTAPRGEFLREALFWLDLVMATNVGIREAFWLQPATLTMPLTPGVQDYSLQAALGSDYPTDGVQFPLGCEIEYPGGNRLPILIASREKWEQISRLDETGVPRIIWMDRLPTEQRLLVWPILPATETQDYSLKLVVQTYAPNVSPGGVSGARRQVTSILGIRQAWQEWLVLTLAVRLGSGAIYKLPSESLNRWEEKADDIRMELDGFENQGWDNEPPTVRSYGIDDYEIRASGLDSADSYSVPMGGYRGFLL